MKVKHLKMNNFRGINELNIEFNERTNIFVGDNGAGKSSILECLAIMISRLTGRIRSPQGGRIFSENDITNNKKSAESIIILSLFNKDVAWYVIRTRRGREKQKFSNLDELRTVVQTIHAVIEKDPEASLPIAVFYSVNRLVTKVPLRIRGKHVFDQLAAHDDALVRGGSDFKIFFEWFRNREDLENEKRIHKKSHRDPQLEAIREAIEAMMPGFKYPRVQRLPRRFTLTKDGEELRIEQLSDGEKCMFALVGDIARRLAIANPGLKEPLEGEGVILIDEVDLHLHPSWQRKVVSLLESTFANCQFILTTHSPQVLGQVKPESIFIMNRHKHEVKIIKPESSFGWDSNRILEDILGGLDRDPKTKKDIQKLFRHLDMNEIDNAKKLIKRIKIGIGENYPDIIKAESIIKRKEILGK